VTLVCAGFLMLPVLMYRTAARQAALHRPNMKTG
jgi:hypothetical protein